MKLFHFYRVEDQSGVSGTGPVVEGVEFTNGWCALRWLSSKSSLGFYQSLEDVKAIHSHGGKTEIVVHDLEPLRRRTPEPEGARMDLLTQVINETARLLVLADDPAATDKSIQDTIGDVKEILDELGRNLLRGKTRSSSSAA